MEERKGIITFQGNPLTLVGKELKTGNAAPDFRVVDNGLAPVTLAGFKGKIKIVSAVPSLDTRVCDTETVGSTKRLTHCRIASWCSPSAWTSPSPRPAGAGLPVSTWVKTLSDYQETSFRRSIRHPDQKN